FFQIFFITCPKQPLTIIGPSGIGQWYNTIAHLVGEEPPAQVVVLEAPSDVVMIADLAITTAPMTHNVPDVAFRLTHQGRSVVYSGDTGMNDQLIPFAQECDVLLLECSNIPGQVTTHHLNEQQCADIAQRSRAKRLLLTHYGDQPFSGTLERAKELLTIKV
ncbi:MAG: beta-lactamase protein, partial [uncultured bacterium]